MSKLKEAVARLECAVARLEAVGAGSRSAERVPEHRELRGIAEQIAVRVDSALGKVDQALTGAS